jgi:hypothetical protein
MAMGLEGMSALMRMKEIQKINTNIEAMLMDPNPLPPDKPPEEVREWMLGPEPTTPWRSFLASVPEAAFKAMPPGITKAMALFRLSDMKIVSPEIAASAERAQGLRGIRYPRKPLP